MSGSMPAPDHHHKAKSPRHGALFSVDGLFATIAHARERQRARLGRQRRLVSVAKFVLPVLATGLLVALVVFPDLRSGASFGRFTYREHAFDEGMPLSRMSAAEYRGVDAKGEKFTITASDVVQVSSDSLSLTRPKGDLTTRSGAWLMLDAKSGMFHQKSERIELAGKVTLYRADGTTVRTRRAAIDIKAGTAAGSDPVSAFGPFGTLKAADGFSADNHGGSITFHGPASLVLDQTGLPAPAGKAGAGTGTEQKS